MISHQITKIVRNIYLPFYFSSPHFMTFNPQYTTQNLKLAEINKNGNLRIEKSLSNILDLSDKANTFAEPKSS